MARPRRPDAIVRILDGAERVLVREGVDGTQMATIADSAGMGLGTLYYYFANKDDLLAWVVLRALRPRTELPTEVPIGPPPISLVDAVAPYIDMERALPVLHAIAARESAGPIHDELAVVVGEFCDLIEQHERVLTIVDVCSEDNLELRRLWYIEHRRALVAAYSAYFERRVADGVLAPFEDTTFAARWLIDTCVLFLRFQRRDYYPDELPGERVRERVIDMLVHGLVGNARHMDQARERFSNIPFENSDPGLVV